MRKLVKFFILFALAINLLIVHQLARAEVRLPKLVSSGMVLQRNTSVNIWGWASPGEKITIRFLGKTYRTTAGANNKWSVTLPPMKAGGPYSMEINGFNHIALDNILIGDVWICSGQSNMVLPMERVRPLYEGIISRAKNSEIRQFLVPMNYDFDNSLKMLPGGKWQAANPWSVLSFSATAYFFAKSLYEKYGVPIGLINASVGGTPISAWMSKEALKPFPSYLREAQKFSHESYVDSIRQHEYAREVAWKKKLWNNDRGLTGEKEWFQPAYETSGWPGMRLPAYWENKGLKNINGAVWFRREFTIPDSLTGQQAKLLLGRIVDADYAYVNGVFVGTTSYRYPPRRYTIAPGILKPGSNTIAVRVINYYGKGGFIQDKPYKIQVDRTSIDLSGKWHYQLGQSMPEPLPNPTFIQYKPTGLFNGMIAPLLNYPIKGAIWYQGESNTGSYEDYAKKFSLMIKDWRVRWHQGRFPFLFVQLPNYGKPGRTNDNPSGWAEIREAQRHTLKVPQTGMAVTIDIGEWNDVHPLNKEEVGQRLALVARKVAYGESNLVYTGPLYESMTVGTQKIILSFSQTGEGLQTKSGSSLHGFTIAGPEGNFVRAQAEIVGPEKVAVWSKQIDNPTTVRYAWADNPAKANLYNQKGLPASPFEAQIQE